MWTKFIEAGFVKPIDLQLARQLATDTSSSLQAFLVHLSIAIRRGHLCIDPSAEIRSIWELVETEKDQLSITDDEWAVMESLVREGRQNLPETLIQRPSEGFPLSLKPIVLQNSKVYTQRSWLAESQFRKNLNTFLSHAPICTITPAEIAQKMTQHDLDTKLLPEQKAAIISSCAPLSLIAGGPGTGKTYTAGWMISILSELLTEKLNRTPMIVLAAPTGKAALHLETSVQKTSGTSLQLCSGVTLHALLSRLPLQADLVVVDEASMIDLEWMNKLLKELPAGARLILMGDPYQLPPVGMGSIFVDMIQTMPHTLLQKCLRTDILTIVEYANSIKAGIHQTWDPSYPLKDDHQLISHCVERYKKCVTAEDFSGFKVLTPFTQGPFGTEQLNKKILHALEKPEFIPILVTKNDYDLELFNGELGLWITSRNVVQFPKRGGHGLREIPLALIGTYQLGYCLTIHKSQGSEYAHVVVVYPDGAQIFGREALYTAVTRAKQSLTLFAGPQVLQQAVSKSNRRQSGFTEHN